MKRTLFILIALIFIGLPPIQAGSWRAARAYQLGAGGTRASQKSDQAIRRDNGIISRRFTGDRYLFGLYLDGGYSTFISPKISIRDQNGWGIGGGLIFEYEKRTFWLQTGVGINFQQNKVIFPDDSLKFPNVPDSWTGRHDNYVYDLTYGVTDRKDVISDLTIQVPLLFGIRHFNFYWGAGPKVSINILGNVRSTAQLTTIADYERYIGVYGEMDNHGWRKLVDINSKADWQRAKIDILASTELGYEWSSKETRIGNGMYRNKDVHEWRIRIGAFADFGILDICPKNKLPLIDVPTDYRYDFIKVKLNSPLVTQNFNDTWARNLTAGIKVTILYGYRIKEICRLCPRFRPELERDQMQNKNIDNHKSNRRKR